MPVTTFSGTVEDGQVKLAANVHLPEKAKVFVVVPDFDGQVNGQKFDLAKLVSRFAPLPRGCCGSIIWRKEVACDQLSTSSAPLNPGKA